jgi:hypothetical protein
MVSYYNTTFLFVWRAKVRGNAIAKIEWWTS